MITNIKIVLPAVLLIGFMLNGICYAALKNPLAPIFASALVSLGSGVFYVIGRLSNLDPKEVRLNRYVGILSIVSALPAASILAYVGLEDYFKNSDSVSFALSKALSDVIQMPCRIVVGKLFESKTIARLLEEEFYEYKESEKE